MTIEVMGHCLGCHAHETIELRLLRSALGRRYSPILSRRYALQGERIIHRPGLCNGAIQLYGKLPE